MNTTTTLRGFSVASVGFNGKTFDGNPLRAKNVRGSSEVLGVLIVGETLTINRTAPSNYAVWSVVLPNKEVVLAQPGDFIRIDDNNIIVEVIKLQEAE